MALQNLSSDNQNHGTVTPAAAPDAAAGSAVADAMVTAIRAIPPDAAPPKSADLAALLAPDGETLTGVVAPFAALPAAPLPAAQLAPSHNAARVYIASLEAEASRATMTQALNVIADLLVPGADLDGVPWGELRHAHTNAVRARLAARYDFRTANKIWRTSTP